MRGHGVSELEHALLILDIGGWSISLEVALALCSARFAHRTGVFPCLFRTPMEPWWLRRFGAPFGAPYNSLYRRYLGGRGERIRTSDLLVPNQAL
jgi:hypothetical protein